LFKFIPTAVSNKVLGTNQIKCSIIHLEEKPDLIGHSIMVESNKDLNNVLKALEPLIHEGIQLETTVDKSVNDLS